MAEREVLIGVGPVELEGTLAIPDDCHGLVLFAHGSGSSRLSPRNHFVASMLDAGGIGTLLFDLLTDEEEGVDARTAELRFDVELLADRLIGATEWVRERRELQGLPLGYFGSSTGAAAALMAAARRPESVRAVVSRGGRPDLAGAALPFVRAPTLLIVGGADSVVIDLNQAALMQMRCEAEIRVVPHATHLFEEPGALVQVAQIARDWLTDHFAREPRELPAEP